MEQDKPNKILASEPDLRQINPVMATGFITIGLRGRRPDGVKRNPGTIDKLRCRSRAHFVHPGYEEMKEEKGSGTP
jgi:hypothetical protein